MNYYDHDPAEHVECSNCGWAGTGAQASREMFEALFEVNCPRCDARLALVTFPTVDETRKAAAAGNPRAIADLPSADAVAGRWARAQDLQLDDPSQLPPIVGDEIVVEWDLEEVDDEHWTVLRHGPQEIWRELAYWEGIDRFEEVARLLARRYGRRVVELRPTQRSEMYLFGDRIAAIDRDKDVNRALRDGTLADDRGERPIISLLKRAVQRIVAGRGRGEPDR